MLNIGDPSRAFSVAAIPNAGVGLARLEFIINNHIGIHLMALARYPKLKDSQAVKEIAARRRRGPARVLHPASGEASAASPPPSTRSPSSSEPAISRPMNTPGFSAGASSSLKKRTDAWLPGRVTLLRPALRRRLRPGMRALARVRREMGLANVKVMIPFCRTVEEGKRVIEVMAANGLKQGEDGLEVYAMCELPSNVVSADEFLKVFDGYSIGSNDRRSSSSDSIGIRGRSRICSTSVTRRCAR